MKIDELKKAKKICVLGMGVEGEATLDFLRSCVPSAEIITADQKDGPHYLEKCAEADVVIKSPGIPGSLLKVPYTTATNIFFDNMRGRTIGVTGTKGKSTTASLITAMLKEADMPVKLVGNIGTPMLTTLMGENPTDMTYVVELSSYQLSDIGHSPHISVLLNLYVDHIPYHGSFEKYVEAKCNIFTFSQKDDYVIFNDASKQIASLVRSSKAQRIPFTHNAQYHDLLKKKHVYVPEEDVAAAATVAQLCGVTEETIIRALGSFVPLTHRLSKVGTYNGITFYDDGSAVTPEAAISGIEQLSNVGTIFLGGEDRGYVFDELTEVIKKKGIKNIVLFPDTGKKIYALLSKDEDYFRECKVLVTRSMRDAVMFAYLHTAVGKVCLLSAASPSYTLWKNFVQKGQEFEHLVRELGSKN